MSEDRMKAFERYQKLLLVTVERGATEGEARNAKEIAERLRQKYGFQNEEPIDLGQVFAGSSERMAEASRRASERTADFGRAVHDIFSGFFKMTEEEAVQTAKRVYEDAVRGSTRQNQTGHMRDAWGTPQSPGGRKGPDLSDLMAPHLQELEETVGKIPPVDLENARNYLGKRFLDMDDLELAEHHEFYKNELASRFAKVTRIKVGEAFGNPDRRAKEAAAREYVYAKSSIYLLRCVQEARRRRDAASDPFSL